MIAELFEFSFYRHNTTVTDHAFNEYCSLLHYASFCYCKNGAILPGNRYIISGMIHIISGAYLVKWAAAGIGGLLVLRRRNAGNFFKLLRKMLHAAIIKPV